MLVLSQHFSWERRWEELVRTWTHIITVFHWECVLVLLRKCVCVCVYVCMYVRNERYCLLSITINIKPTIYNTEYFTILKNHSSLLVLPIQCISLLNIPARGLYRRLLKKFILKTGMTQNV